MSVGAGAIRAGLAVVELSADLGPLDAALNLAAARLKGWAGSIAKIGVGIAGIGIAIAGPILAAFKGAVEGAANMGTLATQLGLTVEQASRLTYALGTVGIGEEELIGFSRHLSSAFSSAADGSHEAVSAFTKLGLNWQELANMPLDERLLAVKEAIGGVTNQFDRATQSAHFFGRRGQELLKLSSEELRKRMAEASDVGAVVTPEQAAQAKEIQRSFAQIGAAMKYAFVEVGRALLPHHEAIKQYAKTVVGIARSVREWISANKPLVLGVLALGAAVTAAGIALVALGVIAASVASLITGIGTVLGVVFSPVGLVVGALAIGWGLAAYNLHHFVTETEAGRRAFAPFATEGKKAWAVIRESAQEAIGGISSALKRGDLKSAWTIVVAGADVAWEQIKASFMNVWDGIITDLRNAWDEAMIYLSTSLSQTLGEAAALFAGTLAKMLGNLADVANRLGNTAAARLSGRSGILMGLGGAAGAGAEALGGVGADAKEWAKKRRQAAELELAAAKDSRDHADEFNRARREVIVRDKRAALQAILDEERARAGVGLSGGGPGGGGPGSLQQAAREVRGTFGVGFTGSASAQQALAVGSTPFQRQLVDVNKQQLAALERIEGKIEGPPAFG